MVSALRETSVLFAAVISTFILKEGFGVWRFVSAGLVTFGLTGYSGGELKKLQQHGLHVALDDMGMVESIHLCLFHWMLNDVFARINGEGRYAQ